LKRKKIEGKKIEGKKIENGSNPANPINPG